MPDATPSAPATLERQASQENCRGVVVSSQAEQDVTEYERLFVSYLWVSEDLRGQGLARRILEALASEARSRGCRDALIETLDDTAVSLYRHLGYRSFAEVKKYVGRFHRHVMLKSSIARAH